MIFFLVASSATTRRRFTVTCNVDGHGADSVTARCGSADGVTAVTQVPSPGPVMATAQTLFSQAAFCLLLFQFSKTTESGF